MELFWVALGTVLVMGLLSQWSLWQKGGGAQLRETHATWKPWAEAEGLQ